MLRAFYPEYQFAIYSEKLEIIMDKGYCLEEVGTLPEEAAVEMCF